MRNNNLSRIDFIGIGAMKGGTTWLYSRLMEVPCFWLPPEKEIHYFDRSFKYASPNTLAKKNPFLRCFNLKQTFFKLKKTFAHLLNRDYKQFYWYLNFYFSFYNDNWYSSLFKKVPINNYCGEITPGYAILNKFDIEKVYGVAPEAKLIFLLRNPIDRAWSHYRYSRTNEKNFNEKELDFNSIKDFINSDLQDLRSNYLKTIENYLAFYKSDNIMLGFYDAISDSPEKLLVDITEYLTSEKINVSNYCNLKSKSNVSTYKTEIPHEVYEYLKTKYRPLINELSLNYGSYCTKWYKDLYESDSVISNEIELKPTIILSSIS